jgi:hypothetical protein
MVISLKRGMKMQTKSKVNGNFTGLPSFQDAELVVARARLKRTD